MKTTTENITPEKALAYLARNVRNRPLRESWVEHLSQQIRNGHWQTTHQGIAFAKNGDLIDGQHRLTAIVRVGKAVQMNVTTGLEDAVYKVTDCGLKRAHSDRIHIVDDKAQNQLLCQALNAYCRFALRVRGAVPVSAIEAEFLRYANSWLWMASQFQSRLPVYGRAGVMVALAMYHTIDKTKASEFSFGYRTGENLAAGSPILSLRRSIENTATGSSGGSDYWKSVSATRAHYQGRTLRTVTEASEDMVGNDNSFRLIAERTESRRKGAEKRWRSEVA